ncbi:hypothetical protein BEP19_01930 [Ammoniphilus oxalaticus]|uniref:Uncharacterized protein n=1 Tax=Ammoniphilus oxalaticus TaxID=66863 RepID=A0A419SN67_9BACL|nr:hypothetical protein [Ammoniphilus oxalaticus]RKD25725.1 hypothetical protein BEP19_01930 [Ammoniphilus oxalaticus]
MRKYIVYLCLTIGLLSLMVFIKIWVIPFLLWNLFPQNDLISKIYEVMIILFGGCAFLLFTLQGYLGKRVFQFHWSTHFLLHSIVQLPFALHVLFEGLRKSRLMLDWGHVFTEGWYGLLAEPTRLILMAYHGTDVFAIAASFLFLALGRKIEIADEQQLWDQARKRMKVGRV